MKFSKQLLFLFVFLIHTLSKADEGMWLPLLLGRNYEDMKKNGLKLTEAEIYSVNNSSLKDAIVWFGGYCTAEVISKNGLILTNHHCGYESIAASSTSEHNYLDDGFWAKNHQQEIPIPGLFASFVIRIQDVSQTVLKELNPEMSESERKAKIKSIAATLEKDAVAGTHYEAFVRDFFDGNEFYLFVTEKYTDVRLVGTPPQSAGKFGGDTDNWMWPRHTADFSMFRIYAGQGNKPAPHATSNSPMTPRHALPISIKGVQENDFAMIMGYPGSTDRYLSSFGVKQAVTLEQPKRVDVRAKKLNIMKTYMDKDVNVRLNYASNYANVANYWKYFIGQTAQVKKNNVIGKKESLEADYQDYLKNKRMSFDVLGSIKNYYSLTDKIINLKVYQSEFIYTVDVNLAALRYKSWADAVKAGNNDLADKIAGSLAPRMVDFFEHANMSIETDIIEEVYWMYLQDVAEDQLGPLSAKLKSKGIKGVRKYMKKLRKSSLFTNKLKFEAFAASPSLKTLEKDPLYILIMDMNDAYAKAMNDPEIVAATELKAKATRTFVGGIIDMQQDKKFYPNANFTLRLTYGNVLPYNPKDGVSYHYTTTLDGVMQKEDPSNPEFVVDKRIKELWERKDYGQYADKNGKMPVAFIATNHTTGGNSGSPALDANGNLIGLNFDRVWEGTMSDIHYDPSICRNIMVDMRYVLFVIDKYAGAKNLIEEMKLVTPTKKKKK